MRVGSQAGETAYPIRRPELLTIGPTYRSRFRTPARRKAGRFHQRSAGEGVGLAGVVCRDRFLAVVQCVDGVTGLELGLALLHESVIDLGVEELRPFC